MSRLLCACLIFLTASAHSFNSDQIDFLLKHLSNKPQQLIIELSDQVGDSKDTETDRLLLLAQSHLALHHLNVTETLLKQIRSRGLSPQQQGWFGIVEAGLIKGKSGQFEQALDRYRQANLLLAPLSTPRSVKLHIDGLFHQGKLLIEMGRYKSADSVLQSARMRALSISDNRRIAAMNEQLGRANHASGNLQLAVEYFQNALTLANQIRDAAFSARLQLNIGQVFRDNGDTSSALRYAHNAAELSQANLLPELHANALSELGQINHSEQQYEQAIYYQLLAIDSLTQINSPIALAKAQMDLGRSYNSLGDHQKALDYLLHAQAVFSERVHQEYLFANSQEIATAYLALGEVDRSLTILQPYVDRLNQYPPKQQRQLLLLVSKANLAKQEHQLAWQQLKAYGDIVEQQPSEDTQSALKSLAEQQLRNQLQQASKTNDELVEQLNRVNRHIYWQAPIVVLLLLALLWNLRGQKKRQQTNQTLQHQVFHHYDTELPNRAALLNDLPAQNGMLLILQLGRLPYHELNIGSREFNRLRQQIALRLGHQEGLRELYEVSPGLFALTVEEGLEINWIESLLRRINNWPLLKQCGAEHVAAGVIELPFQPGSMLHLPAECSLQLAQLALAGALDLNERYERNTYLMLQPVTLNAPLLKADSIYNSAQKCIRNGVIRCCSNVPTTDIRWPTGQSKQNESIKPQNPLKTDRDVIGA